MNILDKLEERSQYLFFIVVYTSVMLIAGVIITAMVALVTGVPFFEGLIFLPAYGLLGIILGTFSYFLNR